MLSDPISTPLGARFSRRSAVQLSFAGLGIFGGGILTACGSDSDQPNGSAGSAKRDKIVIGTATDVLNFDPYMQTTNEIMVLKMFNAWLMTYDENLVIQPSAAKAYKMADDRKSCSLTLRDDVVFQSGKKMTSDDVVFAFNRARSSTEGGNLASPSAIIAEAKADGPTGVILTFTEPVATKLVEDLLVGQPVLDKDLNTSAKLATKPGSAGPYALVDWRPKQSLTLKAFDKWYGGTVATKNIEIQVFTDPKAMSAALSSGSIDIAVFVPPRDAQTLKAKVNYIDTYPGSAIMLLRVSAKTAPFTDRHLRQALWHCVDRERIVKQVLFGFGGPIALPFGPKSPAQTDAYNDETDYNLDKAKELLAQTSHKSGKAMVNGSDPVSVSVMQIIQADLKKIGFDLQIEQVPAGEFQSRLVQGTFGVVLGQMGGGQLSVPRIQQNSLFRITNNPLWPKGKPPAAYVQAINTLTTADDPSTQKAAFKKMDDTLVDEAWAIGTYIVPQLYMFSKKLQGVSRDHQNALLVDQAHF